jgi:hypothetical protein
VQRPARLARHQLALGRFRLAQGHLFRQPQKAVQFAVMCGDPRQERLGDLEGRQLALAIEPAQLGDRQKSDIHFGHPRQVRPFNRTRIAAATPARRGI